MQKYKVQSQSTLGIIVEEGADCKSQRNREVEVRLCLLGMLEATPIKSLPHVYT